MGESGAIWTLALKRLVPRTVRLIVDWWRMRSPVKRPESGSAWTASDPDKGTRKESLRTVRNPCTPYVISRINVLSALLAVPAGALLPDPAINGTKRHIAVDTGGLLLAVTEREYGLMHRVPHLVAVHRRPSPILPAVRHRELRPEGEAFRRGRLLPVLETQPQDGPQARHCCARSPLLINLGRHELGVNGHCWFIPAKPSSACRARSVTPVVHGTGPHPHPVSLERKVPWRNPSGCGLEHLDVALEPEGSCEFLIAGEQSDAHGLGECYVGGVVDGEVVA